MSISRRDFLKKATASAAVAAAGMAARAPRLNSGQAAAGNPLRLPPDYSGGALTAAVNTLAVWPGKPTAVWAYNGTFPGPTFRVRTGQRFSVRFQNNLPESTTVHWHGLTVPASMDGHPKDAVNPGAGYSYDFTVVQRAGLYWYHPHPDMRTGKQVWQGMAGLFIVRDDQEDALKLPSGEFEVPLVLQDRRVNANGSMTYNAGMMDTMSGYLGDTVLVNGTPDAYLEVEKGLYRLRVLNGSNARIYKLGFANGMPFQVIGTDGGLLDKPYQVTSAFISPAERLDLLVDFSGVAVGTSATLRTLAFEGDGGMGTTPQGTPMDVLRFDVVRAATGVRTAPTTLIPIPRLNEADAVRSRVFEITRQSGTMMNMHQINGKTFDMNRIDEEVTAGQTEIWEFRNIGQEYHPMHVHNMGFQILDRTAGLLNPEDMGWKDTILMYPNDIARVILKAPDYTGLYLLHCHNLEHEDDGMMLQYNISKSVGVNGPDTFPLPGLDLW